MTYGNPAEEGKGTIADVMAQAGALDATLMKNEMLFAGNSATTKDCVGIGKDGFSLGGTDVETIVTETDKMKMQLAKAGVDVSCMGDGLSEEVLSEMTGNPALAAQIANSLTQADLPGDGRKSYGVHGGGKPDRRDQRTVGRRDEIYAG